jgi:putative pyrroloquinoline-quinone binding quinoprotein
MTADLDNLFTDVARQADTIPLGTADSARRRGRARRRNRAVVASAAAMVCLVTAGTAAVLTRRLHTDPSPAQTATLARLLPETGPPFSFGAKVQATVRYITYVYAAWQVDPRGPTTVARVDPNGSAASWKISVDGQVQDMSWNRTALVVRITSRNGPRLLMLEPMTGHLRWELPIGADDEIVYTTSALLRWSPASGRTYAYDVLTKTQMWSVAATADPPVRTLRMDTTQRIDPMELTFLQVTKAGKVQLRSARTGQLQRTATIPEPRAAGQTMTAVDGRLFSEEIPCCDTAAFQVRVTDLRSDGVSSYVVFSDGPANRFGAMTLCGIDRLCVLDHEEDGTRVAAIDLVRRTQLWRVPVPDDATTISSRAVGEPGKVQWVGRILVAGGDEPVLLDPDGTVAFRERDAQFVWSEGYDTVVALPAPEAPAAGNVVLVGPQAGRTKVLGSVPANVGRCEADRYRLICHTETGLRFYKLD